jgi:EAL domain-containing protein (putative c-di-GMP-specific phosphodiesterase class I)
MMHSAVVEGQEIRNDLAGACERNEMVLYYQPIVDLESGAIQGLEALIRWHHPRRVMLPSVFIPVAEESGAIIPIGGWVIREACRQIAMWRIARPMYPMPVVHVNVSAKQLADVKLVSTVEEALAEHAVPPAKLVLEITESVMVDLDSEMTERLEAIRAQGVRIAIDDFGTGYSSLRYLEALPVDIVKVDQSFVQGLRPGSRGAEITRSILELASRLNLQVVAEGIELEQQARMLVDLGCREGQGYFFAEPAPAKEVETKLFRPSRRLLPWAA